MTELISECSAEHPRAPSAGQKRLVERGNWASLEIDLNQLRDFGEGGVTLIEELLDYDLASSGGEIKRKKLVTKSAQQKQKEPTTKIKKIGSEVARKNESRIKTKKIKTGGKLISNAASKVEDLNQPSPQSSLRPVIETAVSDEGRQVNDGERKKRLGSKRRRAALSKRERRRLKAQKAAAEVGEEGEAVRDDGSDEKTEKSGDKDNQRKLQKEKNRKTKTKLSKKIFKNTTDSITSEAPTVISRDASAWKDLFVPPPVMRALEELGFTAPTPIQALTLPPAVRDGRDVIGAAETGSGKTLCFGIPILAHALRKKGFGEGNEIEDRFFEDDDDDDEELQIEEITDLSTFVVGGDGEEEKDSTEDESLITSSQCEESDCEDPGSAQISSVALLDFMKNMGGTQIKSHLEIEKKYQTFLDDLEAKYSAIDNDPSGEEQVEGEEAMEVDEKGRDETMVEDNDVFDESESTKVQENDNPPIALVLTPTRELALQVAKHIKDAAKYCDVNVITVVGGMAQEKQTRLLKRKPEIIIATPGRLWEMMQAEPHLDAIRYCDMLVIDEADRMIERGHFQELSSIINHMNKGDKKRQTLIFSATLTFVHSGPRRSIKKRIDMTVDLKLDKLIKEIGLRKKPAIVDLSRKEGTAENVVETRINCAVEEKDVYLFYFLKQFPGRTMVFCNSIDCIRRLVSLFSLLECEPLPLHASMEQRQRLKNVDRFAAREKALLMTSDVAARGLDIPNVQHVVHYQVPRTSETYIHRSGRTARANNEGVSVVLVGPQETTLYHRICNNLNKSEHLPLFPIESKFLPGIKRRVQLAQDIDRAEHRMKKEFRDIEWFETQAKEAELEFDLAENHIVAADDDEIGASSKKRKNKGDEEARNDARHQRNLMLRELKSLKSRLKDLLSKPIFPIGFSGRYLTKEGCLNLPSMTTSTDSDADAVRVAKTEIEKLHRLKPSNPVVTAARDNARTKEKRRKKQKSKDERKKRNRELRGKEKKEERKSEEEGPKFTFEVL